tara:strand:- start:781 stop:1638 length:858 start_codon:yes stop_codon:yes gene_type:complete
MRNILIPTDFSANAWNAISYALAFFKEEVTTFYFLNTYTPPIYRVDYLMGGPAYSAIPDTGIDLSLSGLEITLEKVKKEHPNTNHKYEILSAFNTLTDEINEVCSKKAIDFVVMGTQGATGAKEIFLGSNTVHVIRKATKPVLAVPSGYHFKKIKSVLFPTDYLSRYKEEEMERLIDILDRFKAKLIVLYVRQEGEELMSIQLGNEAYLIDHFKDQTTSFKTVKGVSMPNAIHDYVHMHHIDLLAMMNRKHTFLERLLLKQNVDTVGSHAQIPFLVIPDTAEISK